MVSQQNIPDWKAGSVLASGCGCVPCIYVCALFACSSHRVQKRASDPPELELQAVVHSHVGARKFQE